MNFSLPRFSIRHPVTVLMILTSVVVLGIIACYRMPLKFLPDLDFPFIGCFIPYVGATPEQVEKEIAIPAEGEFRTISHVRRISTSSSTDGCRVDMLFDSGTLMNAASAEVRDRIERLKLTLPKEVDRIVISRASASSIPIMALALFRSGDEEEFVHLVRTVIQPRLSRLDGVAQVTVFASKPEPEVLIEFDQNLLRTHNVALYEILATLQNANLNLSIGELIDGQTKYYARVTDEFTRPEQLANVVIGPNTLRLKDVAKVGFRTREMESHYDIDGKGGAFVIIQKESEANTVETCRNIHDEIARIKEDPALAGTDDFIFFDQSDLIKTALNGLIDAGKGGALLAILILYIFLLRLRPTLVVTLAIPTSLLTALGYMYITKMSLNVITMVSLIVAVGMLVDDAIVVIENIYRHYQLGRGAIESAERGASEVGVAVLASTLTTVVVFIPVLYMQSGEMAAYMRQFAVPMTVALFASLFVAFTLIPLAFSRMRQRKLSDLFAKARPGKTPAEEKPRSLLRRMFTVHPLTWVIHAYAALLDIALRNRLGSVFVVVAILACTYLIPYKYVGMQDMPTLDMREVDVVLQLDQNFDLQMTRQTFDKLRAAIEPQRAELGIKNIFTHFTQAGGALEVHLFQPKDYTDGKTPPFSTQEVLAILSQRLPNRLPGVELKFTVPTAGQKDQGNNMLTLRMKGDDVQLLTQYAERFKALMTGLPNISNVLLDVERAKREVQLQIDQPLAEFNGVSPLVIARTVDVALRGNRLPYLKQGGREFPVWAQFREEDRKSRDNLDNVAVIGSRGSLIPLSQMVSYSKARSPMTIERVDGKNVVNITARVEANDLIKVRKDLDGLIKTFGLPLGYSIDLGDQFTEIATNLANFAMTLMMAIILIYIVMAALFESLILPISILASVWLAFVGVYWGMWMTHTALDTIGLIGCILMVGVVVKNGIVIVDHTNLLRREGMLRHAAVVQAGRDRFRPVMMTALTTTLGVVPLAFESKAGGTVSFVSLGRAFISGLTTGTILTLVVVPLMYTMIEDAGEWCKRYVASLGSLRKQRAETPAQIDQT